MRTVILVINGPNLNMSGERNTRHYGTCSLHSIQIQLSDLAGQRDCDLVFYQSNHEGKLIDFLQKKSSRTARGILINPGALTHYGYSLRDALEDMQLPVVEVHLSDIEKREPFRRIDVLDGIVSARCFGRKERSYTDGLLKLLRIIRNV
jgi:3-dehydroquinate dehydratase II